jgi:Cupin-like domain
MRWLGVSRPESVPNLTRRFAAWLRTDVRAREQFSRIEEDLDRMELRKNYFTVFSQVDAENPDYDNYPRFRDATVIDLELAPGEVLFVPVGWWHHVRALDLSITLSLTDFVFPNQCKWAVPQM